MRAFGRLLVANFKQFIRDRTALFFTFAFPVLFMVIFGLVFSGNDDISYRIGLANSDTSALGQGLAEGIKQVPIFEVQEGESSQLRDALNDGDLRAVVEIPAGLLESIAGGQPAQIAVYYDPSHTTSSEIIVSVLRQMIDQTNLQLTGQPAALALNERSVLVEELENIDYLVPGILAMSVMILGLFGSLTMVEWREKKVLKRLGATPLRRSTVVYSQVVYRLALALVQAGIIVGLAYFAFNVIIVGNILLLVGIVLLGTLTFVTMGYLAVSRAKTVEGAMPIVQILQFPMLFLSGIFFPVEIMPDFMRPIIQIIPVTYLGDALRQVMVGATPLYPLSTDIAVLAAWLVACGALAVRFFRWE